MSPQFVKPYVKSNKNDRNDAEAICESVTRPSMRFVAVRTPAQQDRQALHRVRARFVGHRTALVNQTRGLLAEYGIVLARQVAVLRRRLPEILEDGENELTADSRALFAELYEELLAVPLMALVYFIGALSVIFANAENIAPSLAAIAGVSVLALASVYLTTRPPLEAPQVEAMYEVAQSTVEHPLRRDAFRSFPASFWNSTFDSRLLSSRYSRLVPSGWKRRYAL